MRLRRSNEGASEADFNLARQRVDLVAGGREDFQKVPASHSWRLDWANDLIRAVLGRAF